MLWDVWQKATHLRFSSACEDGHSTLVLNNSECLQGSDGIAVKMVVILT